MKLGLYPAAVRGQTKWIVDHEGTGRRKRRYVPDKCNSGRVPQSHVAAGRHAAQRRQLLAARGGEPAEPDPPDSGGEAHLAFSYDALNRVTNRVDARGTTRYTCHANGQLLTEDGPLTCDTVTYAYNDARRRQSLAVQYANNTSWSQIYAYTARRLTSVVSPDGTFSYGYEGAGSLVTNLALPTGGAITNDFDSAGRWLGTWLKNSGGTVQNSHTHVYSAASQRTNQTRFDNSYVRYACDAARQVPPHSNASRPSELAAGEPPAPRGRPAPPGRAIPFRTCFGRGHRG